MLRASTPSQRDQGVTLFGQRHASPFGIAPMGIAALSAYLGDVVLARAAARAQIPAVLSGSSLIRLEEVMAAAPGTCAPARRACTKDLRTYCGCDGQTFRASGSCPGKRFSARAACP